MSAGWIGRLLSIGRMGRLLSIGRMGRLLSIGRMASFPSPCCECCVVMVAQLLCMGVGEPTRPATPPWVAGRADQGRTPWWCGHGYRAACPPRRRFGTHKSAGRR
ncbi:hypothetical protein FNJ62_22265 [Streptomyces benahoarensis]|uniref:Uncharacterized protein n=1 Tax=Streptomyces benahoarensis TaxID=2595054 RepID=A0A553Z885_9ACTN|nr:hypothetical protein FNJ62_22265 [Streptomyces benahoarensis]TSB37649.1 hypothetical protein FNZ23_18280 [Streptomyces benahoarensis]